MQLVNLVLQLVKNLQLLQLQLLQFATPQYWIVDNIEILFFTISVSISVYRKNNKNYLVTVTAEDQLAIKFLIV